MKGIYKNKHSDYQFKILTCEVANDIGIATITFQKNYGDGWTDVDEARIANYQKWLKEVTHEFTFKRLKCIEL